MKNILSVLFLVASVSLMLFILISSNKDIGKFIIKEQQSVTYNEYKKFLEENLNLIDVSLQEEFAVRLTSMPKSTDNKPVLKFIVYNGDGGIAVFSNINNEEYNVVTFSMSDKNQFIDYNVETLYGVK